MARIFITGATDGLGLAVAKTPLAQGHHVVLHARSPARAAAVDALDFDLQALSLVIVASRLKYALLPVK